ncbi:hypothetical protein [Hungatella sp.]|uniref:hypothetical protein n=1 Tax=Hungatella sp. TaxID=2613924 RepID=UPI0039952FE0
MRSESKKSVYKKETSAFRSFVRRFRRYGIRVYPVCTAHVAELTSSITAVCNAKEGTDMVNFVSRLTRCISGKIKNTRGRFLCSTVADEMGSIDWPRGPDFPWL